MKWEKLGRILKADPNIPWLEGYTGPACMGDIKGNLIEIYLSGRDAMNRSRIGKIVFDLSALKAIEIVNSPLIQLGERGTFDFNGTAYPWLTQVNGRSYLYYTGWTKGCHVDFINDAGLAIADQQNHVFSKISRAPILPRTNSEPFGIGSVCVLHDENIFKMWYTCFVKWGTGPTDHKHYYHIRYADSADGINWNRPGITCIDYDIKKNEYVTGKPCVVKFDDCYVMWYSYRGDTYKIGMAVSGDGIKWVRYDDLAGITVSDSGWDSEMVCYAHVFVHKDTLYMLYNGNGYGKTGLGIARMNLSEFKHTVKSLADEKESELENIIKRYNDRYNKFGYSEESLGWSRNKNDVRYDALIRFWKDDLNGSVICDFGCGFGDLFKYLEQQGIVDFKYYGIDINETLLLKGKELYPAAEFWQGNILDKNFPVKVDFTFSSGVFNHKLETTDEYENIEASIMEINKFTTKGFAINFLSDKVDYFTESNFNSNPGRILEICYKISNNVILCNDYMPFEFTVFVRKDIGIDTNKLIYTYE